MFGAYSETDVTDEGSNVMEPITSMDHVMLEQAENIGDAELFCYKISALLMTYCLFK